jgi:hypothetical protein
MQRKESMWKVWSLPSGHFQATRDHKLVTTEAGGGTELSWGRAVGGGEEIPETSKRRRLWK